MYLHQTEKSVADYTKSNVFRRAHKLTRAWMEDHPADDYHAVFSATLREAHNEARNCKRFADQLNEWGVEIRWSTGLELEFIPRGLYAAKNCGQFQGAVLVTIDFSDGWGLIDYKINGRWVCKSIVWLYHRAISYKGLLPYDIYADWTDDDRQVNDWRVVLGMLEKLGVEYPRHKMIGCDPFDLLNWGKNAYCAQGHCFDGAEG